ncbi:MAG: hypothetical protein ACQESP_13105 [Candidatus Muiribacteriota bacterium]
MYLEKIKNKIKNPDMEYKIPDFWKKFYNLDKNVNIKEFYEEVFKFFENKVGNNSGEQDLRLIQLYLHHFTAYKHCQHDIYNRGTLLKTIAVLPFISEECGFNSIMLLPHFLRSDKFKKGNFGSPYSVKDYYRIDPYLADPVCEAHEEELFAAFIEGAHKLGMKVFIDMVPRTAARDSLWILENPEWFYWIKPENTDKLITLLKTYIDGLPEPSAVTSDIIEQVLEGLPVEEIQNLFEYAPSVKNPEKWERFKKENKKNPDFLAALTKEFGLITPPCSSDCVNDPQPPWTDVTPLRLYEDYPESLLNKYGDKILDKPPFFIQPILKASNFYGKKPLKDLWHKVSDISLYYFKKFDVDGLRGDMFHALPSDLINQMVNKMPADFTLIMENLNNQAGEKLSLKHDFDFYTGNLFAIINESAENIHYYLNETTQYETKILGMPVIGDSVPIFSRDKNKAQFQLAAPVFMSNSAFGITADTLIGNDLPLNYGLGFSEHMQKEFDKKLYNAGRTLSYFNQDYLTDCWDNVNKENIDFISELTSLRKEIFKSNKINMKDLFFDHARHILTWILSIEDEDKFKIYINLGDYPFETEIQNNIIFMLNSYKQEHKFFINKYGIICEKLGEF